MRVISIIEEPSVIRKILRHIGLWEDERPLRAPPVELAQIELDEYTYEPFNVPKGHESFGEEQGVDGWQVNEKEARYCA